MEKIKALIADDEMVARRRIRSLLTDGSNVEVVAECIDGRQTVSAIEHERPNLLFLDPQLPEMDGFRVLQALSPERQPPAIIFVTDFDQSALRAFETHGVDYLLKPFDRYRFNEALDKAKSKLLQNRTELWSPAFVTTLREMTASKRPAERLAIRANGRRVLLRAADIDWIDSVGNYAQLHLNGSTHRLRTRLKDLESRLDPGVFMRIHRSTIVNVDRVRELEPRTHREYTVTLADGTRLSSSRSYASRIAALLDN
ncbi:MAG: LytTR family DNA-binding domain-containing protein [Vicinamibacterales bacterium]